MLSFQIFRLLFLRRKTFQVFYIYMVAVLVKYPSLALIGRAVSEKRMIMYVNNVYIHEQGLGTGSDYPMDSNFLYKHTLFVNLVIWCTLFPIILLSYSFLTLNAQATKCDHSVK